MSPATLTPPPDTTVSATPAVAQPGPAAPALPVRAPFSRGTHGDRGLRVSRGAVAVSLVVHVVLAVLLVLGINEARRRQRVQAAATDAPAERVSYLDVGEWPSGAPAAGGGQAGMTAEQAVTAAAIDSAIARAPELQRFPDRVPTGLPPVPRGSGARGGAPSAAPGAQGGNGAGNGVGTGAGNGIGNDVAGGRYGAGYGDRRLIVPPQAVPERQRSEHERYMEHLNDRLTTWNDSVAAEADHQRRIRNWTVKDRNGREWGIGEGGTPVIAGRKIPIPLSPPIYVDRDQENAQRERTRQRAEIDRQIDAGERARSQRESAERARRRTDEERRRRREAQDSTRTSP
ncbi:MAG TPA: hypothetical protein VFJ16_23575 [Longimicrobium sp.]|nr:hypothetical protein [Longimicrobium sp.]